MFNNVALDVVIGLVFIYLLYSLLATVIAEIIATKLGLRARNLKEAIDRMLNDEDKDDNENHFWPRLWDSLKLMKNPKNPIIKNFYNHPEIKYLGSTGIFKNPSSFKAVSFSKTILYILSGEGAADKLKIESKLKKLCNLLENQKSTNPDEKLRTEEIIFDSETAQYVKSLWDESYGDIVKFKLQLENWFDRTMEQATEWYKRKIQLVLLIIGFMLAWFFNADTFTIVHKLSNDKGAREQMVKLASAYVENNKGKISTAPTDSTITKADMDNYNARLDSLSAVKKQLEVDIANANTVLGSGAWLPDTVMVTTDAVSKKTVYAPALDEKVLLKGRAGVIPPNGKLSISTCDKWGYLFGLFLPHFFGFLITAIAISLGAPFWFDLLNKLMQLRSSTKQETDSPNNTTGNAISPLNRVA